MTKLIFSLTLLLATSVAGYSQNLEKALATFSSQYNHEKIYLHLDKEQYAPGETIWFKGYLYNYGYPSTLSNNFFIQLLNRKGEVIDKKLYPVSGATVSGNISIPENLLEDTYILRAVTPGLAENKNESFVYYKKLLISNRKKDFPNSASVPVEIKFYPESGNLIDGLLSVVAFKATDANGLPVAVSGTLLAPGGIDIRFKSSGNGMGRLQFRPKLGHAYYAEVDVNGKTVKFPLPEVKPSGVNIKVQDEKGGKMFQLSRVEKEKGEFGTITLVAQMNNRIVYDNVIPFDNYPSVKGHLITDSLPSGVLQFTVFNQKMEPIAERLSFVNNKEFISPVNVTVEKKDLSKRGENKINLTFPDTIQRSLSISVTDASVPAPSAKENIFTNLLLTSELTAPIHNAPSFLTDASDSIKIALDNLMMTQTSKRFQWSQVLGKTVEGKKWADPYLITVKGEVEDQKDKELVRGGQLNIFLEEEDSTVKSFSVPVTAQGNFIVDSLLFFGNGKFYYSYKNASGKERPVTIKVSENDLQKLLEVVPATWKQFVAFGPLDDLAQNNEKQVSQKELVSQPLENVTIQTAEKRTSEVVNEKYASGLFKNAGKIVLDNINFPHNNETQNVVTYLEQNLRTVKFQNGRFVNLKNFSMKNGQHWEVGLLLNETPVNTSILAPINISDVALIKFYEAGFPGVSSNTSPGGAISIYLKRDEENKKGKKAAENYFAHAGYSIVNKFPITDVVRNNAVTSVVDDRTTLYWNPAVYSSKDSSYTFSFLNNDVSKKLRLVIEGFDAIGRLIYIEKIIE